MNIAGAGRVAIATLGLIAIGVSAAAAPRYPARQTVQATGIAQRVLTAHNRERAVFRLPLMAWDPLLAAGASSYAQQLAASGRFEHSSRRARRGTGENLWMGSRGAFSLEQMIGNWASEKRWFRPGPFPNISTTGNWAQVGHYSQIVWPTTTRVGCGLASGRGRDLLVCRYAPAGNIDGRRVP